MDYEQKYYDALFEIKQLKEKIKYLENELEIYKSFQKNKDLKRTLIELMVTYQKKGGNYEQSRKI